MLQIYFTNNKIGCEIGVIYDLGGSWPGSTLSQKIACRRDNIKFLLGLKGGLKAPQPQGKQTWVPRRFP